MASHKKLVYLSLEKKVELIKYSRSNPGTSQNLLKWYLDAVRHRKSLF